MRPSPSWVRLCKMPISVFHKLRELDFEQLMAVYQESNAENCRIFYSNSSAGEQNTRVEQEFYEYLMDFFTQDKAAYYVLSHGEKYLSALRLEPYEDGLLWKHWRHARISETGDMPKG